MSENFNENQMLTPDFLSSPTLRTLNIAVFGNKRCGKKELLLNSIPDFDFKYATDSSFKFKRTITLDNTTYYLMIRNDGDEQPKKDISQWAHCGIFCFHILNENSYLESIKNQKKFIKLRKGKKRAPTILVGSIGIDKEPHRLRPYDYLLKSSRSHDFQQYIELHVDTIKNVDHLFQYITALTFKYFKIKMFSHVPNNPSRKRSIIGREECVVPNKKQSSIASKLFRFTNKYSNSLSPLNSTVSRKSSRMSLSSDEENLVPIMINNEEIMKQGILDRAKYLGRDTVFVTIYKDGVMFYHKSQKHFLNESMPINLDLLKLSATCYGDQEFKMINLRSNFEKPIKYVFKAENMFERDKWVEAIRLAKEALYKKFGNNNQYNYDQMKLKQLQTSPFNDVCAECNSPNPEWINFNLGIFICTRCSGGHRKLRSNIIKVTSSTLNTISSLQVIIMEKLGNLITNSVFEETLNLTNHKKPLPNNEDDVYEWLKMKYVEKRFIAPLPFKDDSFSKQFLYFLIYEDYRNQLLCIHNSTIDEMNEPFEDDDRTPFMTASQLGYIVTIQLLAWAGVDVDAVTETGFNAYSHAVHGKPKNLLFVLDILEKVGVRKQKVILDENISVKKDEHSADIA